MPLRCHTPITNCALSPRCPTPIPKGLLAKTGLQPRDVDILVTTCSIFCPTPSMASMVVNHFKMRPDVQAYHLGGMGCANGTGAILVIM